MGGSTIYPAPARTQGPSVYQKGGVPLWGCMAGGSQSALSAAWSGCYYKRGSLDFPWLFPGPPPSSPDRGARTPPVVLGGRGRGRPVPAEAAARRGRGGAAPPPLSPNRVTGGAARVSLRAKKCGPNSQDRSRPLLTRAIPAPAGSKPQALHPGVRRRAGSPPPRPGSPHSPPGWAPRD